MIQHFDLEAYSLQLALAGQTGLTVKVIRRMVEGQRTGYLPASRSMPSLLISAKMGQEIRPSGSNLELAHQFESCEWDDTVAGYVTQPEGFSLSWINKDGSHDGKNHIPDALLLNVVPLSPSADWSAARFVEVKHTSYLEDHVRRGKGRYVFDESTGKWRSPAAEKSAREIYGFPYKVVTEFDIDHLIAGNINYLYDYMRPSTPKVPREVIEAVRSYLATNQGTTFAELLLEVNGLTVDRFLTMIVHGQVVVPLDEENLYATTKVRVYTDQVVAEAHKMMLRTQNNELLVARPPTLQVGEQLQMDQVAYEVLDGAGDVVRLRDEALGIKSLGRETLFRLHRDGRLRSLGVRGEKEKKIQKILQSATTEGLFAGMERLKTIEAYLTTDKRRAAKGETPLTPTNRYWLAKARAAFADHGDPLVGCIDRISHRGGRKKKTSLAREQVITNAIDTCYLIPEPQSKCSSYESYKKLCVKAGVGPVSYKTFSNRLKALSPDLVALKQEGEMASGQHAPPSTDEPSLTSKAQYFMQVVQMDEYVFDVASIDPQLGRYLGQFWVVVMLDVYSRTVLAIFVSFEEPSYALTTLPTLRKCVQRWKRVPSSGLTDRGTGFKEGYAKGAIAMGMRPTWRPAGKGRGAPQVERVGGVSNQRIAAELRGHTGVLAKYRRVSKTHDPAERAVYIPEELTKILERYFFETYDNLPHGGLNNRSPREMRELSLERDGTRKHTEIVADSVFEILSLPGPARGDGTVVIQEHDGLQQDGLYYWHPKFALAENIGARVQMRWDPCDITHVFAYVGGKWEECICIKLRELRRLPREQLCLTSIMIRRDRKKYKRGALESVAEIQKLLNGVRKTEDEIQEILRMREAGKSMVLALPPIHLTPEPDVTTTNTSGSSLPPGLPSSYLKRGTST